MKMIHLSDLHLGKRVNGFSMLEDQRAILDQILDICGEEQAEAVLLAGDIYDKPVPPAEAVSLFDSFLTGLAGMQVPVFIISGNHDSAERLAFGGRLMKQEGIHLAPLFDGTITPVVLQDAYGEVNFYLMPFLRPQQVRHFLGLSEELSCDEAVRRTISVMEPDTAKRNVLLAHQMVTGAQHCESEELNIGGLDQVDASAFEVFDYVALGHLHGPQNIGTSGKIRYCGTPLKYSFSEANQTKSVTVAELGAKGELTVRQRALLPLHDLREIRGIYMELTALSAYRNTNTEDYLHVTLNDEEDVPDALNRLRVIYPNIMKMDYDNVRTRQTTQVEAAIAAQKSIFELFSEFYEIQNNQPLTGAQQEYLEQKIKELKEEE